MGVTNWFHNDTTIPDLSLDFCSFLVLYANWSTLYTQKVLYVLLYYLV